MQIASILPPALAAAAPVKAAVELVGGSFAALLAQAGDDSTPQAGTPPPIPGDGRLKDQRALAAEARPLSFDELRAQAEASWQTWHARLTEKLQAAGIDTLRDFALQVSADGTIREVSGHPDGAAIEQILASDSTLGDAFRQIVALRDLLAAAESNREFATAYGRNPTTAVEEYASLFAGLHEPATIRA